jgi:predicted ATP-grasp superfamily ATP-dependent carboligase
MWPPGAGSASFAETIEPPAELVSRVEALLESVGWEGIFEVEVLSLPDGRLAAMDLNPRVFGWMTLARQAGVNIAAIWCDAIRGEIRPRVTARPGVAYRWEDAELFHLVRSLLGGRFDEARSVLRPRRGTAYGYGRLNDPGPLAARMIDVTVRRVAR